MKERRWQRRKKAASEQRTNFNKRSNSELAAERQPHITIKLERESNKGVSHDISSLRTIKYESPKD